MIEITTLLEHINNEHETDYRLDSRFPDGEHGAFRLQGSNGPAVLKRHPGAAAVARYQRVGRQLDELRSAGYPAPRCLHVGTDGQDSYLVQEVLAGSPPDTLTPALLGQLIRLNHLQQNRAEEANPGWQEAIIRSVLEGMGDYCIVDSLRNYSPETAQLLDVAQQAVRDWDGQAVPTGDIVHFDYHHRNILADGEQITPVNSGSGTRIPGPHDRPST